MNPSLHIRRKYIRALFPRLHAMYIEKGGETSLPFLLKNHVQWYKSQGKNIVFANLSWMEMITIVIQNDDGSYELILDDIVYDNPIDMIPTPVETKLASRKNDDALHVKISAQGESYYYYRDSRTCEPELFHSPDLYELFKTTLKLDVNTLIHHKYHSYQYIEEIWQKACHPTVVENAIATYPSTEAFVNDPNGITAMLMLKCILV